jgi:hypothetical protein
VELHTLFRICLGFAGAVFGLISIAIFREINNRTEEAMVSFQLKPRDAVKDFEILLAGQVFMMLGFFSYLLGGLLTIDELLSIGRLMAVMFAGVPIITFYRWWRRF